MAVIAWRTLNRGYRSVTLKGMETRGTAYRAACATVALLLVGLVTASGGPPRKEHWSEDRSHVLKVDVKAKTLTLKHDTGNGFAVDWSIKFPQELCPSSSSRK